MNIFIFYLKLGINHILDIHAIDHMLFIAAMIAVYGLKDWKHVFILATAFTIGHSATLALSLLNIVNISSTLIEFLISATIFITGVANLFKISDNYSRKLHIYKYITALFFGLIHGLGFSYYLKYLLGEEENILKPLLAFNIGIELGQIFIVIIILIINYLCVNFLKIKRREWNLVLSGMAIGVATLFMLEKI